MRGAKTIGGSALLVALLLGAPGCATAGPVTEPVVATAGLEPSASAIGGASAGGGVSSTCNMGGLFDFNAGEVVAACAIIVIFSPFFLVLIVASRV